MSHTDKIQILTTSLSNHLTGNPLESVIKKDWSKRSDQKARFNNIAFDFDGNKESIAIENLKQEIHQQDWDGILIGWCIRGNIQYSILFENIIQLCRDLPEITKIMFCTGPDDLVESTLRNFSQFLI